MEDTKDKYVETNLQNIFLDILHTTVQRFGVRKIFECFSKKSLQSLEACFYHGKK